MPYKRFLRLYGIFSTIPSTVPKFPEQDGTIWAFSVLLQRLCPYPEPGTIFWAFSVLLQSICPKIMNQEPFLDFFSTIYLLYRKSQHVIIDIGWICLFSHCGFAAASLLLSVLINNFLSIITDATANTTSATNCE